MENSQNYLIVKKKDTNEIAYFEYDKLKGYDITPKKGLRIKDAIEVNKVVLINSTMIDKMIEKKLNKKLENLLHFLTIIYQMDESDESGAGYFEALNQISKLRQEAYNKYHHYLDAKKMELWEKKLDLLEHEVKLRLSILMNTNKYSQGGKSR